MYRNIFKDIWCRDYRTYFIKNFSNWLCFLNKKSIRKKHSNKNYRKWSSFSSFGDRMEKMYKIWNNKNRTLFLSYELHEWRRLHCRCNRCVGSFRQSMMHTNIKGIKLSNFSIERKALGKERLITNHKIIPWKTMHHMEPFVNHNKMHINTITSFFSSRFLVMLTTQKNFSFVLVRFHTKDVKMEWNEFRRIRLR